MKLHTRALCVAILAAVAAILAALAVTAPAAPSPGYDDCNAHPEILVCTTVDAP